MLHAYVQRFDVTENLKKFCKILRTKKALRGTRVKCSTPFLLENFFFTKKRRTESPTTFEGLSGCLVTKILQNFLRFSV